MCGIFGILNPNAAIPPAILASATRSLAHRGPDDSGTAILPTVSGGQLGFAHTRLSIIDLSPLGHQPMHDPITGNGIVFNGEIYNYRELRAQLESGGHRFQSYSDTEVILAAYRAWGPDSFSSLRGMFAFALWDALTQTLLLVRDPMGIKPLYYGRSNNNFLFASEVRTLLQSGLIPRQLDKDGLFSFLAFGSVYEPRTIIAGIRAIPAGHVVSLANGAMKAREYWNPLPEPQTAAAPDPNHRGARNGHDPKAALRELPKLLRHAVLSHLVSDVPVGVFLSGGIDSSSLVAIMSQAGVRPATFSLVFREQEFNESEYSRQVASRFATDHHEIMVSEQDALARLPEALAAMDQPTIDGINTWLVSSQARSAGMKVALTGLGADELFAGYSNFRDVPRLEQAAAGLAMLPSAMRKPVRASIALLGQNNDRNRKLSALADPADSTPPYFLARALFNAAERRALWAGKDKEKNKQEGDSRDLELHALEQSAIAACERLDPINRVSYLESTCYMRNTLLRDSDFMSMAHALELRVPFLDPPLVKACFQIPGTEKLEANNPKSLLTRNLGVDLPPEIIHRPKRGFTLPFERWMRAEMRPQIEQALRPGNDFAHLNPQAVNEVWTRFQAGKTSWSRPWSLFVLHHWCRQNL